MKYTYTKETPTPARVGVPVGVGCERGYRQNLDPLLLTSFPPRSRVSQGAQRPLRACCDSRHQGT